MPQKKDCLYNGTGRLAQFRGSFAIEERALCAIVWRGGQRTYHTMAILMGCSNSTWSPA